jgi:hypothetical protein
MNNGYTGSLYFYALITSLFNNTCIGLTEVKQGVSHNALAVLSLQRSCPASSRDTFPRRFPMLDDTIFTKYSKGLSCVFKLGLY